MFRAIAVFSALQPIFISNTRAAIGPVTELDISNVFISPDGFNRSTVLANGQFPGPLIKGKKGDHFRINVTNTLSNSSMVLSTTVHWHGINQKYSNWADGVGYVTQCPIIPGEGFQYDFTPVDQAGTFWYHSHLSTQYCDGLRGPLVIYDPDDPHKQLYDIDDENTIITISDWFHTPASQMSILNVGEDSTLINGAGRYTGGPLMNLTTLHVDCGKRYRFRLLSLACETLFTFSIDGHNMTVIEVDGNNVEPLVVDSIEIFPGQRYSVVLDASQEINNYWIRALPDMSASYMNNTGGQNAAILRYNGAAHEEPTTNQSSSILPLNETDLHALSNPAAPGEPYPGGVDQVLNFQVGINFSTLLYNINNVTFESPTIPVLLQILSGVRTAQELVPSGSIYSIPGYNKTVEINIYPSKVFAGDPHSIHLHGQSFSVVRSAGSETYNFANPVRRDVTNLGLNGGNGVTIRFRTEIPGPWFFHCHSDFHVNTGFAAILATDVMDADVPADVPRIPPYDWFKLCPNFYGVGNYSDQCMLLFIAGSKIVLVVYT